MTKEAMFTIGPPPTEADVHAFASRWTAYLVAENYDAAYDMLCHVQDHPGRSWVGGPEALCAWIENYGSPVPIEGEPLSKVTSIETAAGEPWESWMELTPSSQRYPGYAGRLDWGLPLNGEWSDLQASFDLVERDGRIAFALVALRVP